MSFEDDWKALRPHLPADPHPIDPDRFPIEEISREGLILPGSGVVFARTEPEFVGSFPVRTELTVLGADDPDQRHIGWTVREMTDEDIAERDSPENLELLRQQRLGPAEGGLNPNRSCWTTIPVLQELWGRPWNAAAANFIQALRPSTVRVTTGEVTLDSSLWRVTVYIRSESAPRIVRIEQEVEVGAVGFRNGQDAGNYLRRQDIRLTDPQPSMFINSRALARLGLSD